MKDRLSHLRQVKADPEGVSAVELDCLSARAAAVHSDQDLDGVLQEARQIRLESVNHRSLDKTTHPPASEPDSNVKRREGAGGAPLTPQEHSTAVSAAVCGSVMASYNDAKVSHREACERHIRTQIVH